MPLITWPSHQRSVRIAPFFYRGCAHVHWEVDWMIWRRFSGAVEFKMFGAGGAGVALDCVLSVVWEEETDCLLLLPELDWFLQ